MRWSSQPWLLSLASAACLHWVGCSLEPPAPETGPRALPSVDASCATEVCALCSPACFPGEACCAGRCVELSTDVDHCGACGASCVSLPGGADASCVAGRCETGGCAAGAADCDGDPSNGCEPVDSGLSATCPGTSCAQLLRAHPASGAGVYWVEPDGLGATAVVCDMETAGGGWTLLLKATQGDTFAYDAVHWTTPTVHRGDDLTRDDSDAKYDAFNRLPVTDLLAVWPDFAADGQPHLWLEAGVWSPGMTALDGFQRFVGLGLPQDSATFDARYFSSQVSQGCAQGEEIGRYGINLNAADLCAACPQGCGGNGFVRWGYRFNENGCCNWGSDDAGGGIGVSAANGRRFSAGDWFSCCGAVGANRPARVELWGR